MICLNLPPPSPVWTIYRLTSPSGKVYLGQTSADPEKRWEAHCYHAEAELDSCPKLCRAIRKYGFETFDKEILDRVASKRAANFLETQYIDAHDSVATGYNVTRGGEGVLLEYCRSGRHKMSEVGRQQSQCAECRREKLVAWKKNHPEIVAESRRKEHAKRREQRKAAREARLPPEIRTACELGHVYAETGRNNDGSCKVCYNAKRKAARDARKLTPEYKAAKKIEGAKRYQKVRNDPELWAKQLEVGRIANKKNYDKNKSDPAFMERRRQRQARRRAAA